VENIMKIFVWLIPLAGAILVSSNALAGDATHALADHPAVSVARTGAHPAYQDAMKAYGHPAGGGAVVAVERPLRQHPAVTVARTGARPTYQDGMKVYGHPAGGSSSQTAQF
jgi:hypothetical protein